MNTLVATLGTTWQVLPEIFAYTNPGAAPLYEHSSAAGDIQEERKDYGLRPVQSLWIITTEGGIEEWQNLCQWQQYLPEPIEMRCWYIKGIEELFTPGENRAMADLIYRVALHARLHTRRNNSCLYFALAGGRKTMSAELQQAAHLFGADALLHVVDRFAKQEREQFNSLSFQSLCQPLPKEFADSIRPLVTNGDLPGNEALLNSFQELDCEFEERFPLPGFGDQQRFSIESVPAQDDLHAWVKERQKRAEALLANYRLQVSAHEKLGNFRALYGLSPQTVEKLRQTRLGCDQHKQEQELAWLRRLPKAELHCHLGGILDSAGMIRVAEAMADDLAAEDRRNREFAIWRRDMETAIRSGNIPYLKSLLPGGSLSGKPLRDNFSVTQPLSVAALLYAFRDNPQLLDSLLYGVYQQPSQFTAVGIESYEELGNLQGSGLLQSEKTLRAAMAELGAICRRERIGYLELRCSPLNYVRGDLDKDDVVRILVEEAERIEDCDVRLLFIASRHRDPEQTKEHIELALHWFDNSKSFRERFVGFDLAGAEHAMQPAAMREYFLPLHERVVRMTIHAGEGERAENIWEAVYELSADRIGHGLTLKEYPDLIDRFRDRRIALEMCPSSNRQIRGYYHPHYSPQEERKYPLSSYLEAGLRVSINTDNPGISRTSLSEEFLTAAQMTPGGLSAWHILQIIRNGYQAAFCGQEQRRSHLIEAEKKIIEAVQDGAIE